MTKLLRLVAACLLTTASSLALASPARADTYRDQQWHLPFLRIAEAHKLSQGEGITVAVIDSGIQQNHPDLQNNVLPGLDLVAGGSGDGWGDDDGHGSAMAGLIAAHGHGPGNNDGALGIAPKAKILPIRVGTAATANQRISGDTLLRALKEAISQGAKIVSISTSTGAENAVEIQRLLDDSDILVVAAAGNLSQGNLLAIPASYHGVLAVGSVDRIGDGAGVSVLDPRLFVTAPGVEIVSSSRIDAVKNTKYRKSTGSSPSTAIVGGTAALIWAKNPQWTAEQVAGHLAATATDKGPTGRDEEYGFGVVDPVRALTTPLASASQSPGARPSAAAPSRATDASIPAVEAAPPIWKSNRIVFIGLGLCACLVFVAAVGAGAFLLIRRRA